MTPLNSDSDSEPKVRSTWALKITSFAPVLVPMIVSAVLSYRQVSNLPLSHDEFYTLDAVVSGLRGHMWEAPLIPYYAVVWAVAGVGALQSDVVLRSVSAVSIVFTVGLTAQFARMFGRPWLGYPAGLLLSFNGLALCRAAEARPYAVGAMLATLASVMLVVALRSRQRRWMIFYSLVLVALVVVFPQGLLVLVPQAALVASASEFRQSWRRWLTSLSPALLAGLVGAALAWMRVFPNMHNWLGSPGLLQIPEGITWAAGAGSVNSWAAAAVAGALIALGLSGEVRSLTAGVLVAVAVLFVLSQGGTSFWLPGSLVALVPLVVAAAAVSLDRLPKGSSLVICLTILVMCMPVYTASRIARSGEADMRKVALVIAANPGAAWQLFGDSTDAYGLWPTLRHYGPTTDGFTPTHNPNGRFWLLYGDVPCDALKYWDVGGGMRLRLCQPV